MVAFRVTLVAVVIVSGLLDSEVILGIVLSVMVKYPISVSAS